MMVVHRNKQPDNDVRPIWEIESKRCKVVAAVTFTTCFDQGANAAYGFITWCLVDEKSKWHPSSIDNWRRQGFGLFLIELVIKFCYAQYLPITDATLATVLFLQCFEPAAKHFYLNIGFVTRNTGFDDGFFLLPDLLQEHLLEQVVVKDDSKKVKGEIFHAFKEDPQSPSKLPYNLMQLNF